MRLFISLNAKPFRALYSPEEVANVIWLQKSVVWASEFVNL